MLNQHTSGLPVTVWSAFLNQQETPAGRRSSLTPQTLPGLGILSVTDEIVTKGTVSPPHMHPDTEELFYMLEGEVAISALDPVTGSCETELLSAGNVVHIPPLKWHWYTGLDVQSRFLSIYGSPCPHILEAGTAMRLLLEESSELEKLITMAKPLHDSPAPVLSKDLPPSHPTTKPSRHRKPPAPPWMNRK